MDERRADPGFTVAPRRLGDDPHGQGPRRGRRLGVALVTAAAAAIIAIAFLGPRLSGRPNLDVAFFATPTPAATPTPSPTLAPTPTPDLRATPLPVVTPEDGGTASGRVAFGADGMRVIDLADGTIEKAADAYAGRDAVVRHPDGLGWMCVCMVEEVVDDKPIRIVRLIDIDSIGQQTGATDLATLPATYPESGPSEPLTDVDLAADGRTGLLAVGHKVGPAWTIAIASLDVDGRRLGPMTELGAIPFPTDPPVPEPSGSAGAPPAPPAPSPPPEIYVDGPHVRIAPGRRVAFVWAVLAEATPGIPPSTIRAWRVELGTDGAVGEVRDVAGFDDLPFFCPYVGFAASDRLAWLCPRVSENSILDWQVGAIDLDGRTTGIVDLPVPAETYLSEPMFDRANGVVYVWEGSHLVLTRVDAHTLDVESVTFDPATTAAPGRSPGGGTNAPDWHDSDSAVQQYFFSQMSASPDGSSIYLVGYKPASPEMEFGPASLGILVVDRSTLALEARWAPAAAYVSVAVTPDGLVLASGAAGVDTDGREAQWQGSLTVHDPADGRILVRYGRLSQDSPPIVFDR